MKKINYKSDFDFILRLRDCGGNDVGWPEYDWTARFYTSQKVNAFVAKREGGECVNCYNDDGRIHIVADGHKLGAGVLNVEFTAEIPNGVYPDDAERIVVPLPLDIELIRAAAPCPESFEVEVLLPYIKGDKGDAFTFGDFTPEQIEVLQRPALEAAEDAKEATGTVIRDVQTKSEEWGEAERQRVEAEDTRVAAEKTRAANETARGNNESARKANEEKRVADERERTSAETLRKEAESARQTAEGQRDEAERQRVMEFEGFASILSDKADRTELSNVCGEEELTSETFPEIETVTRQQLRQDLFIDIWNKVCGAYGKHDPANAPDAEHPYCLNGLWLTYNEALTVYGRYRADYNQAEAYARCGARTNIPYDTQWSGSYERFAQQSPSMETAVICHVQNGSLAYAFYNCQKLRTCEIKSSVNVTNVESMFHNCKSLTNLKMRGLARSLWLDGSPLLTVESVRYLCENRGGTSAITVTLHADVYDKIINAGDASEWAGILDLAVSKNITLATTT